MSDPYLGEIKLISFTFPPRGWAYCNGQLLPINQNQALFSILGTQYGGNGQTNFALPNLQGRVPVHWGGAVSVAGQAGGEVVHTLSVNELPTHVHAASATAAGASSGLTGPGQMLAQSAGAAAYGPATQMVAMDPGALAPVGGGQPHPNEQPYLTVGFCIALTGIYPSRS